MLVYSQRYILTSDVFKHFHVLGANLLFAILRQWLRYHKLLRYHIKTCRMFLMYDKRETFCDKSVVLVIY